MLPGKPYLPGDHSQEWQARYPKDQYGFTRTSAEGRLLAYLEAHPNQFHASAQLLAACRIASVHSLQQTISAIREVIEPDPARPVLLVRGRYKQGYQLRRIAAQPSLGNEKITA